MPHCKNHGRDVATVIVDVGDDTGPVLCEACADCLVDEP
jgi:hypothetical protein